MNRETLDCAKSVEADQTRTGKRKERRKGGREGGRQLYARWMTASCIGWTVRPAQWSARHSAKRGKAISGRKRRNASFPLASLAKEKMEENKKIHSAVAEERSGGEGSERSTSKKELLLRPWQRISSSGGGEEGTPSVHPSAHRTTKMIGRSRIQGKARRGPARVQDV